jgi:hypothetical protein
LEIRFAAVDHDNAFADDQIAGDVLEQRDPSPDGQLEGKKPMLLVGQKKAIAIAVRNASYQGDGGGRS